MRVRGGEFKSPLRNSNKHSLSCWEGDRAQPSCQGTAGVANVADKPFLELRLNLGEPEPEFHR